MAPRFVHGETGVVVNVDEERAAHLDKQWTPLDVSAPPPPAVPVVQDVQAEPEPSPDAAPTVEPPPSVEGGSVVSADVQDAGQGDTADDSEPSEEWTVNDLKAFAQIHGIDLAGAEKKADILARVRAGKTGD